MHAMTKANGGDDTDLRGADATARVYKWATTGDINAFFGLMLDNVVNLAVLAGILVAGFGFPATLVYTRMFPGTALGVLFGDVVYTVMAIRLARRTGRDDVTAMPLGLDAPSTIGMALTVLGPAFLVAKTKMSAADAAVAAWQVGMATMVLMGVFKLVMSFIGDRVRRAIPRPDCSAPSAAWASRSSARCSSGRSTASRSSA